MQGYSFCNELPLATHWKKSHLKDIVELTMRHQMTLKLELPFKYDGRLLGVDPKNTRQLSEHMARIPVSSSSAVSESVSQIMPSPLYDKLMEEKSCALG